MKVLVTGGCGFIGSNYVLRALRSGKTEVTNLDKLTAVSNRANLEAVEDDPKYQFVEGDIADLDAVRGAMAGCDVVVNFAAESHVDRSILDARGFYKCNVEGTLTLLDAARESKIARFLHVSTDEVYGSLGESGTFTEETSLAPNSPYAASKAAADLLVRSYVETYKLPALITRCCNNYGPFQFPEKLIPLMTIRALEGKTLPVYGDGSNVRDWIHVEDHCSAIDAVIEKGTVGEIYNVGSRAEKPNLDIVKGILGILEKPESLIRYVTDRPGHDWRYSIDPSKLERETDWVPAMSLAEGLEATVRWYVDHPDWWEAIRGRPSWQEWFGAWYDDRLAGAEKSAK